MAPTESAATKSSEPSAARTWSYDAIAEVYATDMGQSMPFDGAGSESDCHNDKELQSARLVRCRVNAQLREAHPGGG